MVASFTRTRLLALLQQLNLAEKPTLAISTTTTFSAADFAEALKPAGVLVPLIDYGDHFEVLLTERATTLKNHAGHISFPGGGFEQGDQNLAATALRETTEEIGLAVEKIRLFGCLSSLVSSSGYLVTPFVGLITPPLQLKIDTTEVTHVFTTPLDYALDESNYQQETLVRHGKKFAVHVLYYQTHHIWGLTAAILVELRNYLKTTDGKS